MKPSSKFSIPFQVGGEIVQYLNARQLAQYIPKTRKTLIHWAELGIIPGIKTPPRNRGGHPTWLFDLFEVQRALKKFRV
jgi:hypothetical protein